MGLNICVMRVMSIIALGLAAWDYSMGCGCEGVEYCDKCREPFEG